MVSKVYGKEGGKVYGKHCGKVYGEKEQMIQKELAEDIRALQAMLAEKEQVLVEQLRAKLTANFKIRYLRAKLAEARRAKLTAKIKDLRAKLAEEEELTAKLTAQIKQAKLAEEEQLRAKLTESDQVLAGEVA